MAAVLPCGPEAVLSHTSAAALWQLIPQRGFVHVTVPANGRHPPGIACTGQPPSFRTVQTVGPASPSRTLRDLPRLLPQPHFAAALRQAEFLGLPLDDRLEPDHARSELEARFPALLRRHRLPQPGVNVRVGSHVVDFLWMPARLVADLDGYRTYGGRVAFEGDGARDVELKALRFEVIRLTWRQVTARRSETASTVRKLLHARGQ